MTALNCPSCEQTLRPAFYEGVKVQLCLNCKGIFMNRQELHRIEATREADIAQDQVPPSRSGGDLDRECPKCGIAMVKQTYGRIRTTEIDTCEACDSVWLDRGELDRVQADFELAEDNSARNKGRPGS